MTQLLAPVAGTFTTSPAAGPILPDASSISDSSTSRSRQKRKTTFVKMVVAVQYYVLPEKVYDAVYKLEDAKRQITSFVFT